MQKVNKGLYHLEFNIGVDEIMYLVNALKDYQCTNQKVVRQGLLKIKKLINGKTKKPYWLQISPENFNEYYSGWRKAEVEMNCDQADIEIVKTAWLKECGVYLAVVSLGDNINLIVNDQLAIEYIHINNHVIISSNTVAEGIMQTLLQMIIDAIGKEGR